MKTVKEILQVKGYDTWSVAPDVPVYDALKLMADKNVGAVLVIDAGNLVGIMSERDYARKVILKGKSSKEILVREIMTEKVLCVRPDQTIKECMVLMTDKRVRHLPILEDDRLIGVISIGDVVNSIISEQEYVIERLGAYIWGGTLLPRKPDSSS
ncbi:MAG: CBS domain-containing protein [Anaerolineae bacterium]